MLRSEYQRERAICVIERAHRVTITRAGELFLWSKPGGGDFAVTLEGLLEIGLIAETAEALQFNGAPRHYSAEF